MEKPQRPVFRRIMRFVSPYRLQLAGRLGLTLLNAVMGIVTTYGVALVVRAATELSWQYLYTGIAILVFSLVVEAFSTIGGGVLMSRVSYGGIGDIKGALIARIMHLSNHFFDHHHSGDISSVFTNDVSALQRFIDTRLTIYIYYPVRFVVAFIALGMMNWQLLIACCVVIPLAVFGPQIVSRRVEKKARHQQEELALVNTAIQEALTGVTVLKSFGTGEHFMQDFDKHNDAALENARALTRLRAIMDCFAAIAWNVPYFVCILYGAYLTFNGQMEIYQLSFFVSSMEYLAQPIANIPRMLEGWKQTSGAAERILALLDAPVETGGDVKSAAPTAFPVQAEHLRFAYGDVDILKDVTFAVPAGKTCALVGASGSGKSTLVQLLCGFYTGYAGGLSVLGQPLSAWHPDALRQYVSYVSQDAYLFPVSIYENIAMGKEGATREEVEAAARGAGAHDFITALASGYDTLVGERGARLSGGQRQRITIARAMLKDAPLLLLDEPTSALDVASEAEVQRALDALSGGKTVVVVAHRMSTIKGADQVVVLDAGRVSDIGRHEELMQRSALYQALYQKELQLLRGEENV